MNQATKITSIGLCIAAFSATIFAQDDVLDTDEKKFSYAVGTKIGEQLNAQFREIPEVDIEMLMRGLNSVVAGEELLMSEDEATQLIQARQQQNAAQAEAQAAAAVEQRKAFLEENAAKDGVTVTDSGLQYSVIESGDADGVSPSPTDTVVVHYQGSLIDGTVFDSSYSRGEPATFSLQGIILGWQEALQLMRPGDKWSIVLPPELGYGENGAGGAIGPNEVLLFDVELLEVLQSGN